MLDFGQWQPAADVEVHLAPVEPLFVAATAETAIPALGDFQSEAAKSAQIAGHGMIAVVAPQHALQSCALPGDGVLPPMAHLLSNDLDFGTLTLRHALSQDAELAVPSRA